MIRKSLLLCSLFLLISGLLMGQDKFAQLYNDLPTPNSYRTASGAPGPDYWQQRADYKIKVRLDDQNQRIIGEEMITYYNNSPDALTYLRLYFPGFAILSQIF